MPDFKHVTYSWDDSHAAKLDAVGRLVYRSNILGADQRITNTGGGNTSSKIVETDPGLRGDTASGGTKPAKLETGAVVQVPLFVEQDTMVKVDTRTGDYLGRVN